MNHGYGGKNNRKILVKKQMLAEIPCLAHYAKHKDNLFTTTDGTTTGVGITRWQEQDDENTKPIASGGRYLSETKRNTYIIG